MRRLEFIHGPCSWTSAHASGKPQPLSDFGSAFGSGRYAGARDQAPKGARRVARRTWQNFRHRSRSRRGVLRCRPSARSISRPVHPISVSLSRVPSWAPMHDPSCCVLRAQPTGQLSFHPAGGSGSGVVQDVARTRTAPRIGSGAYDWAGSAAQGCTAQ